MSIAELIQHYGYAAVIVGTFLEGETVLLLAGAAASHGHLSLLLVMACAALASFVGDQFFFFIGRRYGSALLDRFTFLRPRIERAKLMIDRYHAPLILSIRFLYGIRIAGPIALGMSDVHWSRFLILNSLGAVVWSMLVAGLGYGAGNVLSHLFMQVDADELWSLAVLLAAAALWWLFAHRRARRHQLAQGVNREPL